MPRKIFIAATGQNCGKTTTSLSLVHLARKKYGRVGFIKPLGPKPDMYRGVALDKDAALMARVFARDLIVMSPVVVYPETTRKVLDGEIDPADLERRILQAYEKLERECDFIIIEGSGHPGVGSVLGLSNARIARLLDAPVLMVTGGGVGSVVDGIYPHLALFEKEGVQVRALLANKLIPEKRNQVLHYLERAFTGEPFKVIGGFDYQPTLADPTLSRISKLLGLPLKGNRREAKRIIHNVQIGAASTQRVVEMLRESSLLIVTSSRDELLVTMANLYQMPEYRSQLVGLVIPGIIPVSVINQRIIEQSNIPYLRTHKHSTAELYRLITEDVSKITHEDTEKLALIRSLAESRLDFEELDQLFA